MFDILENLNYDFKFALTAFYMWLVFGYLSPHISCDLQKLIENNIFARHIASLIAFLLLFTLFDNNNKNNLLHTFKITIFAYALFILLTKSKLFFTLIVFGFLLCDQFLKFQIDYYVKNEPTYNVSHLIKIRKVLSYLIITVIFIGAIHYFIRQKHDHKDNFQYIKFFTEYKCNKLNK